MRTVCYETLSEEARQPIKNTKAMEGGGIDKCLSHNLIKITTEWQNNHRWESPEFLLNQSPTNKDIEKSPGDW